MAAERVLQALTRFTMRRDPPAAALPVYETLPNTDAPERLPAGPHEQDNEDEQEAHTPYSPTSTIVGDMPPVNSITSTSHPTPPTHQSKPTSNSPPHHHRRIWPPLRNFLADFTLGFADGLTVPFALTAGLSSLGETRTVIYAGMAEICAGSISMGIGGYLSARGEARGASQCQEEGNCKTSGGGGGGNDGEGDDDETGLLARRGSQEREKRCGKAEQQQEEEEGIYELSKVSSAVSDDDAEALAGYLAPLRLPPDLERTVLAHLRWNGYDRGAVAETLSKPKQEMPVGGSPIITGLSVAMGYLIGGVIPLFPYFFVSEVGAGLLWSFFVCIIAMFCFGFGKELVLSEGAAGSKDRSKISWPKIRSSAWEGLQMVVLGGIAALAAVLCVRLFDGML